MALPLEGIRLLDMSVFQQGTYASAMFADMGADVIKVESPDHPDPGRGTGLDNAPNGMRPYFHHLNRNKRGISIDISNEQGREVLLKLVETADIFHNNMRPGVLERLGITYDVMAARNPRIIVSRATGWGHLGPDAEAQLGSMDILAQARGGIMSVTGTPDTGALPVGVPFADHVGALVSAYGMMVALWERQSSGKGQEVNTSLYGSQMCIQTFGITAAIWNGESRGPTRRQDRSPTWTHYEAGDGKLIMVGGPVADRWWNDFCDVLGVPELHEESYTAAMRDADVRERAIVGLRVAFKQKPRDEWLDILQPKYFVQPVSSYLEIAKDPQAWANGYLTEVPIGDGETMPTVGPPVNLSRTPGSVRHFAPELGQHTEEVLVDAGYSWDDIAALREQGAFGELPATTDAAGD